MHRNIKAIRREKKTVAEVPFFQTTVPAEDQRRILDLLKVTWGDLLDWHPHVHGLFAWGLFDDGVEGGCRGAPHMPDTVIHDLFRLKVFRLLREEGLIEADLVADMLSWPHSGFHVWVGGQFSFDFCLSGSQCFRHAKAIAYRKVEYVRAYLKE